jgi:predicted DNA-binding transcriptional regulator AlpA
MPAREPLLTTSGACAYLQIGRSTLYKYARLYGARRRHVGRSTRWVKDELDRMLERATKDAERKRRDGA